MIATRVGLLLATSAFAMQSTREQPPQPWLKDPNPQPGTCKPVDPELQLLDNLKIAMHQAVSDGDTALLKEGILDHPKLTLVSSPSLADYVFWSVRGDSFGDAKAPPFVSPVKVILIDWSDGEIVVPYVPSNQYAAVFKRSMVSKLDGVLSGVSGDNLGCPKKSCFPFAFGVLNQYLEGLDVSGVGEPAARRTSVVCSLRPWLADKDAYMSKSSSKERESMLNGIKQVGTSRNRILSWLHHDRNLPTDAIVSNDGTGAVAGLTRESQHSSIALFRKRAAVALSIAELRRMDMTTESAIGPNYRPILRNSLVAVTGNPACWEGDHRLWEHLASGNAVLGDELHMQLPFGPVPGKHFIQFDVRDVEGAEQEFQDKLSEMLEDPVGTKALACRGLRLAMRHHRSVSRVDYILRSIKDKEAGGHSGYTETGLQLRERDPKITQEHQVYAMRVRDREREPDYIFTTY